MGEGIKEESENHATLFILPVIYCLSYTSSTAWSKDSKLIAVAQWEAGENRLIVVDVTQGLFLPKVTTIPLPLEKFLKSYYRGVFPKEEYDKNMISFMELKFSEANKTIDLKSWSVGAFEERTVTVPITTLPAPNG